MANYLFIDVETTGLGTNAAVIEIACIPMVDGEIKPHFHSMVRPHEGCTMDPKAFKITKIDVRQLSTFPEAKEVISELIKFIDSHETVFNLAGHNVSFDRNSLFRLFCRNGHYGSFISRFNHNDICTLRICREVFKGKRNKPMDFKLESICRFFEIEINVSHRSLADITNTVKVFMELEKLKQIEKDKADPVLGYHEKMTKYMDMKYIQMNPEGDVFITKEALSDPFATKFILNFLWEKHVH